MIRFIADGLLIVVVVLSVYALIAKVKPVSKRYDIYARIIMAGLTAYMFAKFIGYIWQPATLRPFEILGVEPGAAYLDNPGFPSDHMLFATFLTLAVCYATKNKAIVAILAILSVLVAVGRVQALVHTPLDVIGGAVIAMIGVVWYIDYAKLYSKLTIAKKAKK